LFGLLVAFTACKKDPVPGCMDAGAINYSADATEDDGSCVAPAQRQGAFAINYTATWCSPCGSWGVPAIHDMDAAGPANDVVTICSHASGDPMHNSSLYNSFKTCRPTGGGIPSFWVGDEKTSSVSAVNTLLSSSPVVASAAFVASKEGTTMTVDTKVKFYTASSGEYYISIYILESGIAGGSSAGQYAQSGASSSSFTHDFVLRTAYTPSLAYGTMFASGSIASGATFDGSYSIPLQAAWNLDNVYVAVCIWEKNGTMYEFVNGIEKPV